MIHPSRLCCAGSACLLMMLAAGPVSAQTDYFWNAPNGGAGTWDTLTQNWATNSAGPLDYTWTNSGLERANFGGTGGAVALAAGGITAFGVNFNVTGYALTGGPLTLAGAGGPISTGSGVSATISAAIGGTVGMTKSGAGTLTVGVATTYTGDTLVTGGTLRAGAANVFSAGGLFNLSNTAGVLLDLNDTAQTIGALTGGGTTGGNVALGTTGALTVGGANTSTTYTGLFTGAGTVTKVGTGTLTLAGSSTWTGPLNISGGVVSIDSSLRLGPTATATGTVTLNGGTLRNTNPGNAGSFIGANRPIAIGPSGGTVDYTSSNLPVGLVTIYAGTITGVGNTLTKVGPGEFRFQGAGTANSTFTRLVVNEGLFRLGNVVGSNFETGFGAAPAAPLADAITLNGGAIGTSYNVTLVANRGITLGAAGGTFTTSAGTMTVLGVITGGGALNKTSTGTLILNGVNTYTGITNVTAGTLQLGAVNALPTASTVRLNGGILRTGATTGFSQAAGPLTLAASSTITLGTGVHVLNFTGLTAGPVGTLTVGGWTGSTFTSGTAGRVVFNDITNFDSTFLAAVQFTGFPQGAFLVDVGGGQSELVPVPEPATVLGVAAAGLGLTGLARRVRRSAGVTPAA